MLLVNGKRENVLVNMQDCDFVRFDLSWIWTNVNLGCPGIQEYSSHWSYSQGSFLAKSGTEETRALNTGTFQAIYQLSNVFGNLLGKSDGLSSESLLILKLSLFINTPPIIYSLSSFL